MLIVVWKSVLSWESAVDLQFIQSTEELTKLFYAFSNIFILFWISSEKIKFSLLILLSRILNSSSSQFTPSLSVRQSFFPKNSQLLFSNLICFLLIMILYSLNRFLIISFFNTTDPYFFILFNYAFSILFTKVFTYQNHHLLSF